MVMVRGLQRTGILRKAEYGVFRGDVGAHARDTITRRDGSHIDDHAARFAPQRVRFADGSRLLRFHRCGFGPDGEQQAHHVDLVQPVEVVDGTFGHLGEFYKCDLVY